ncbi:hypothetical protein ECANGB1_596 [Enterospora canceri]|uniref:Uncharacterized protein n=1 Tax=Enterospora canceri TaxID=1081671 RepID=A0A1Y1S7V6_9MICR|nr:hypothetical protein ECANGB1_596 [Enterospora canceri]
MHRLVLREQNRKYEGRFALKNISIEKAIEIGPIEILRNYVHWNEGEVEHTVDDFIGDLSMFIKQNVLYGWFRINGNIFTAGTEEKQRVYRGDLFRVFLGMDGQEVRDTFGEQYAVGGIVLDDAIKLEFNDVILVIRFPVEYKAELKTKKGFYSSSKMDLLRRNELDTIRNDVFKKELIEYLNVFKKSAFLRSKRLLKFRRRFEIQFGFTFITAQTTSLQPVTLFHYVIPNKNISNLDCIE